MHVHTFYHAPILNEQFTDNENICFGLTAEK